LIHARRERLSLGVSRPNPRTDRQGGTHHGVSAKHLPRYLREWEYRFNRRNLRGRPALWLIRRAVECATISHEQIVQEPSRAALSATGAPRSKTQYPL